MNIEKIKAEQRNDLGKKKVRALRSKGRLPAVIYGHGEDPESISLNFHEVELALMHGARTLSLEMSGEESQVLIKEVQYDHLDHHPIHLDLLRVNLTEKVHVQVSIELKGEPAGAKDGGILDHLLTELDIECPVTAIPNSIVASVNGLNIGDYLRVSDLPIPDGVELETDPEEPVATVREPATEVEPTEEDAQTEGEEAALPEVIGKKSEEEGESEG